MAIEVTLKEVNEWEFGGRPDGKGPITVYSADHVESDELGDFYTPLNFEENKKVAKMVEELEEFRKRFG